MRRAAVLLALALLPGCVLKHSQPARLYVLDALAPAPAASDTVPVGVVGVTKVAVPGWIDRAEITGRSAQGEVVAEGYARWGEPLARGIQRVVVDNLAALLPDRTLLAAPFPPRQEVHHRVELTVTEAARQADGSVLLEARWRILDAAGTSLVQRRSSHRMKSPAGAAGVVSGTSAALAALSEEIATAVRALPRVEAPAPKAP